jgi:hypothetical protein
LLSTSPVRNTTSADIPEKIAERITMRTDRIKNIVSGSGSLFPMCPNFVRAVVIFVALFIHTSKYLGHINILWTIEIKIHGERTEEVDIECSAH